MVDLEKIKKEVKDVCVSLSDAFVSLGDRAKEREEADKQIDKLKTEIVLFNERKTNAAESAREEGRIAGEIKKKHTATKNKYRKLIDEVKLEHAKVLSDNQTELEFTRTQALSSLNAEKGKIANETKLATRERDDIRKDYFSYKDKFKKLKEGIPD